MITSLCNMEPSFANCLKKFQFHIHSYNVSYTTLLQNIKHDYEMKTHIQFASFCSTWLNIKYVHPSNWTHNFHFFVYANALHTFNVSRMIKKLWNHFDIAIVGVKTKKLWHPKLACTFCKPYKPRPFLHTFYLCSKF